MEERRRRSLPGVCDGRERPIGVHQSATAHARSVAECAAFIGSVRHAGIPRVARALSPTYVADHEATRRVDR